MPTYIDTLTKVTRSDMSPIPSYKPLPPVAGNLFAFGIHQLHGVIHQVSWKDVKVLVSRGVNNAEKRITLRVILHLIINL